MLLSVQIEGTEGIQNYKEIVKVEGIGCIQTGRTTSRWRSASPASSSTRESSRWSSASSTRRLSAGKQVSLVHPANDDGIERINRWIEQGVLIHTVETDLTALHAFYARALARLKG